MPGCSAESTAKVEAKSHKQKPIFSTSAPGSLARLEISLEISLAKAVGVIKHKLLQGRSNCRTVQVTMHCSTYHGVQSTLPKTGWPLQHQLSSMTTYFYHSLCNAIPAIQHLHYISLACWVLTINSPLDFCNTAHWFCTISNSAQLSLH